MVSENFALRASFYVDPIGLIDAARADIQAICDDDEQIGLLGPAHTTIENGRVIVSFNFAAEDPEVAEQLSNDALRRILSQIEGGNMPSNKKRVREGSNLLTFA